MEKELVQLKGLLYVSHNDHFPALKDILPNTVFHTYGIIFPDSPVYAYKMGLVQVVLGGIGAIAGLIVFKRFLPRARTELIMSVLIFGIAFFFSQPPSLPLWETIPLLPLTQFPWRFLLLMALPTSIATGYLVDILAPRWRTAAAAALVVFCLATNLWNLKPIMANQKDPEVGVRETIEFELLYHLVGTTVAGEYVPRWVTDYPWVSPEALGRVVGARYDEAVHPMASDPWARVILLDSKAGRASYHVSTDRPSRVVLNLAYFPGWKGWLDDQPVDVTPSEPEGMLAIQVPAGEHSLRVSFENTPLRSMSDAITVVAVVFALATAIWAFRPRGKLVLERPTGRELAIRGGLIAAAVMLVPLGSMRFFQSYYAVSPAQVPVKITLGDVATLTGYDLLRSGTQLKRGELVEPGTSLMVNLYWKPEPGQADRAARSEAFVRLTNIDEQNWSFATETARESIGTDGSYRTSVPLEVPAGLAPGVYQLDVGALSQGRNIGVRNMELVELLPTQGSIRLGPLHVTEGGTASAGLRYPAKALFADKVGIEGFQLTRGLSDRQPVPEPVSLASESETANVAAGETLQVDIAWRALATSPGIYHMSASLVDEQGFTWAVRESEPVDRMAPTWTWVDGQLIRDQLRMAVPPETPPGRYRLAMRVLDGERALNVLDQNGNPSGVQAMLGEVLINKAPSPPREREVQVTNRERVRLNDDVDIMGGEYGRNELAPGESLDLQFIWRALRDVKRDYQVRVALESRDGGRTLAEQITRPTGDANPTNRWEEREIFRGQYRLIPRPGTAAGEAQLVLELRDAATGRTEVKREVQRVTIRGREGQSSSNQKPTVELDTQLGSAIALIGYTLDPGQTVRPGRDQQLLLTLFWKANAPPGQALTVFTQLLGPDGRVAAQHDGQPDGGAQPTSGWVAGDHVVDEHAISIDRNLPAGEYRLITGMYDPVTSQRLTQPNGENFFEVAKITVDPR